MRFVALEAHKRCLAGRAVHTHVCDIAFPLGQMRFESLPAREAVPGDGVLLHIPDAALRLALSARPIRRAGPRRKAPMLRQRNELVIELHRSTEGIVAHHERARVVHQHLLRHAAKGCECALEAAEPVLLLLGPERPHMQPPRVPERRHEHERLDPGATDLDQTLAEVDLQLSAGRRFEPRRRQSFRFERLPVRLHRPLQSPPAHRQPLLGQQILAHHVGVAAMPHEPLAQPVLVPVKLLRALRHLERLHATSRQIGLHRVMAAAQLPRNPLQPPAARLQPQHLRHVVWRLHHLPPWVTPRRASRDSFCFHALSPQLSEEGAIPRDAEGAIFHGAGQRDCCVGRRRLK